MKSRTLVDAAKSGDQAALSELLLEHRDFIANVVYRFIGDSEQCRDVIQSVFMRVIKGLGTFEGGSRFTTWIYRITVNECIEFGRKERVAREYHEQLAREPSPAIEPDGRDLYAELSDRLLKSEINAVLEALPLQPRTAFYLFYRAGYSGKEGAEAMNITEANFFMKLKAARDRIRKRLLDKGFRE